MKTKTLFTLVAATALCGFARIISGQNGGATPTIDSMPPVVVKTVPEAGAKDVEPGLVEIKVVFSKKMMDQSWSPSSAWKDSTPEFVGKPRYDADAKTWLMKVNLAPGKTYGYWLNSQKFGNFKDAQGHSAVPYLFVFQTKDH